MPLPRLLPRFLPGAGLALRRRLRCRTLCCRTHRGPALRILPGIGSVPASPQVTFLSGGRLYAASLDGSGAACLGEAARPLTLAWSATADRVLLGGLQRLLAGGQRPPVEEAVRSPRWSRPTGKSTIHISIDQRC
ncbi:MAG: hypothetical protein ACRDJ4_11300 [Actinomycetota bacterium]